MSHDRVPRLTREELLAEHFEATGPQTADSYMAKEHIWLLGDRADITRKASGKMFAELCFPILRGVRSAARQRRYEIVRPEDLGLSVKRRHEVDMPPSPIQMNTGYVADNVRAHVPQWLEAATTLNDAVLQIRGTAELEDSGRDLELFFTPMVLVTLHQIAPILREFPATQAVE